MQFEKLIIKSAEDMNDEMKVLPWTSACAQPNRYTSLSLDDSGSDTLFYRESDSHYEAGKPLRYGLIGFFALAAVMNIAKYDFSNGIFPLLIASFALAVLVAGLYYSLFTHRKYIILDKKNNNLRVLSPKHRKDWSIDDYPLNIVRALQVIRAEGEAYSLMNSDVYYEINLITKNTFSGNRIHIRFSHSEQEIMGEAEMIAGFLHVNIWDGRLLNRPEPLLRA